MRLLVPLQPFLAAAVLMQVAQEVGIMKEAESERQAHFLRQYAANCVADLAAALQRGDLAAGGDLASGPQHHDPAPMQPAEQ